MNFVLLIIFLLSFSKLYSQEYNVGNHDLFLMPTAYTIPKDSFYFANYELIFIGLTYGLTNSTQIGVFSFFPLTTSMFTESFSLAFKQNYFESDNWAASLTGTYLIQHNRFAFGNVITYKIIPENLHTSFNLLYTKFSADNIDIKSNNNIALMLGFEYYIKNKNSLILEYLNVFENNKMKNSTGIIVFGYRLRTSQIAWDFGAIRPLYNYESSFIAFPFIKATVVF